MVKNLFITTCKHSLLLIFALTYSAHCSGMSDIEVFLALLLSRSREGWWDTFTSVDGPRPQLPSTKFLSKNFRLRTTSGDISTLTILIHCLRCARMLKTSARDYYTWLIGAVTNQEPRKTIGYCFENNRLYCFPNPRWPPQISTNQEVN